jgi:thioredoxin-related protein
MRASLTIFSILCLTFTSILAQNTEGGIAFIHEQYMQALNKAKTSNKILFVDAYTTWCAPCKLMDKNVFPQPQVASFFNQQFINLKLDMEKGEGVALAKSLGISAYPTFLFLDGEGQLLHKGVGFQETAQLIELGKMASNSDKSLSNWVKKYENGNREATFLKEYALKLAELYDDRRTKVAEDYMATQSDWNTPDNLEFIYRFVENTDTKLFGYFLKNKKAFESKIAVSDIELKIQGLVTDRLFNEKNLPTLRYADSIIQMVYPQTAERMNGHYRLNYFRMKGDRDQYAKSAVAYFKKNNKSADELSEAAVLFHEQIQDKGMLKKATKWAQKAVKLDNSYMNMMILAQLYADIGKKEKAQKQAQQAIEKAKANNEPFEDATEFLKTLK